MTPECRVRRIEQIAFQMHVAGLNLGQQCALATFNFDDARQWITDVLPLPYAGRRQ
jgi:hypothetical protein